MKGCDPKFLRNLKFAKKHNLNKHQIEKKMAACAILFRSVWNFFRNFLSN